MLVSYFLLDVTTFSSPHAISSCFYFFLTNILVEFNAFESLQISAISDTLCKVTNFLIIFLNRLFAPTSLVLRNTGMPTRNRRNVVTAESNKMSHIITMQCL